MNKITISGAFERDLLRPCSSNEVKTHDMWLEDDPQKAAERAVEMANRPGKSGGAVILCVFTENGGYLSLVEPGDTVPSVESDIREKANR